MDENKLTDEVRAHLGLNSHAAKQAKHVNKIDLYPYNSIVQAVSDLAKLDKMIWVRIVLY